MIINIVQPGQLPTPSSESASDATGFEKTSSEVSTVKVAAPRVELEQKPAPQSVIEPSGFTEIADETEANSSTSASRRRRRRSSALDGSTSTLEDS